MGTWSRVFLRSGSSQFLLLTIYCKMDIQSKDEFIYFMQRACEDPFNDCYIELYNILLRAFVTADIDFDGQVSEDEFEGMISAAAEFPKKFGYEWWAGSGKDNFKAIDENGDGGISFDEWLNFSYTHYKNQKLPAAFDQQEKDTFVVDCKDSSNTGSDAYKDGQVSGSEFATMVNVATAAQKRLGLPAPFQTSADRDALFAKMDENGDGAISYDEWLSCFMTEIIAPVAAL